MKKFNLFFLVILLSGLFINPVFCQLQVPREGIGGVYNSSQVQGVWSISPSYKINTTSNDFGTQYGMCYAHTNAGTGSKKPLANFGHQITYTNSGTVNAAISLSYGHAYFKGKIGIGTTAPQGLLHIVKDGNKGLLLGYYGNDIQGRYGSTGQYNGDLILNYWVGNVGIGTLNPREKLEVNGHLLIPADKELRFGTENTSTGFLKITNATCCYNTYADFKGNLYFRHHITGSDSKGSVLSLQQDGTVIIGNWERYDNSVTPTNGSKLMVNGKILCEAIEVVNSVPTSDYVFEKDYNLRSLKEVEQFVSENKHLPEVPSANDFKENGYNMNDFDDLLLRKVEELTLYIIEQNKRIEALEVENIKLRKN